MILREFAQPPVMWGQAFCDLARRRFAGEVQAVRRVAPFCTAQVLDADLEGDHPYIVSEYIDGVSLRDDVAAHGPRADGALDRSLSAPPPRSPPSTGRASCTATSSRATSSSQPNEDETNLRLDEVSGDACYPGTVTIRPRGERQATFEVSWEREDSARYTGTITRIS